MLFGMIVDTKPTTTAGGTVFISATAANGTANGLTTSAIDTSGANLIVVMTAYLPSYVGTPTVNDNKGNGSYTSLTRQDSSDNTGQLYYIFGPTVGTGHTFSLAATGSFASLSVAAFKQATTAPFDVQSAVNGGPSNAPVAPSVTPGFANELVISGYSNGAGVDGAVATGIDAGTIAASKPVSIGVSFGSGIAWLKQTTTAAWHPTWTLNSSTNTWACCNATFKGT
jgi:hypothetical protein